MFKKLEKIETRISLGIRMYVTRLTEENTVLSVNLQSLFGQFYMFNFIFEPSVILAI